jgi:hypothetical protein
LRCTVSQKYPNSRFASQAQARIQDLDWQEIEGSANVENYRRFLKQHPNSRFASQAQAQIETLDWQDIEGSANVEDYRRFLQKHADSRHAPQAHSFIDNREREFSEWLRARVRAREAARERTAWDKARKWDRAATYENYLREFPDSEFSANAKERIDWLRANGAVVDISYPDTVRPDDKRFRLIFRETGGKAGFKLTSDPVIIDPQGKRWTGRWTRAVEVQPKGTVTADYWGLYFVGSHFYASWFGSDDHGNEIRIVTKVRCVK